MTTSELKTPPVTPMATPPVTPPIKSSQRSEATVLATARSKSSTTTLSTEPVTDEMFEKAASTRTAKSSIRATPVKPTKLTFGIVQEQPHTAKSQLVLCNISDRVLHFRLKSSGGSNIVSVPFGNGHIAPHAQIRLTLTWTRDVMKYKDWTDVPRPKLILTTRFLDINQENVEETHTRLVAKLGKKPCPGGVPPTEQLLLDANAPPQQELLDSPTPKPANNIGQQLADFVNNLSDRGIVVLILILAIVVIIFSGGHQR